MSTAPLSDPHTMPIDDLGAQVRAQSDPQPTPPPAEPTPAPAVDPAPAPVVPEPYSVVQNETGVTVQMSPEFGGEVFKGKDWAEVGPKIAKAKADANAYIRQLKSQPAQPQTPAPTPAPAQPEDPALVEARKWVFETLKSDPAAARDFFNSVLGVPVDNLVEATQQMTINASVAEFHRLCPDYVDTPENTAAIESYFPKDLDHFPSSRELQQAYAMALYEKKIAPAAPPQNPAARPLPMPGATTSDPGGQNPWTMPMSELEKQIRG